MRLVRLDDFAKRALGTIVLAVPLVGRRQREEQLLVVGLLLARRLIHVDGSSRLAQARIGAAELARPSRQRRRTPHHAAEDAQSAAPALARQRDGRRPRHARARRRAARGHRRDQWPSCARPRRRRPPGCRPALRRAPARYQAAGLLGSSRVATPSTGARIGHAATVGQCRRLTWTINRAARLNRYEFAPRDRRIGPASGAFQALDSAGRAIQPDRSRQARGRRAWRAVVSARAPWPIDS